MLYSFAHVQGLLLGFILLSVPYFDLVPHCGLDRKFFAQVGAEQRAVLNICRDQRDKLFALQFHCIRRRNRDGLLLCRPRLRIERSLFHQEKSELLVFGNAREGGRKALLIANSPPPPPIYI